jgi:EAL domain-containing protein (putative c-di-GMP-specific phosphodiesterase class I)
MVFQPITDLAGDGRRIVGVEALARFPVPGGPAATAADLEPNRASADDVLGAVLATARHTVTDRAAHSNPCWSGWSSEPERWFAGAAEIGIGTDLELAAVRAALAHLSRLPPGVFMSVNVSAGSCGPELAELLRTIEPRRILLEITEHSRLEEASDAFRMIAQLRARGVRIGADDVGSGYAGLSQLLALRPDMVKIDRNLTHGIDTDPARRAITNALIQVADEIGATVLAEGIETAGELETLRATRVRLGQGNHIAQPAPLPSEAPADLWEVWAGAGSG